MNFRLLLLLALAVSCLPLRAADDEKKKSDSQPKVHQEGWLKHIASALWPFKKKTAEQGAVTLPKGAAGKAWRQLLPAISIEPMPLKLAEVRTLKVTLRLSNRGRKLVQLDFPTTQRIEVLVKDSTGKMIEQWSEDQAFQNEPTLVAINPAERLEYTANVATRDLKAGQTYTVEGFFPNFNQLRASRQITPVP